MNSVYFLHGFIFWTYLRIFNSRQEIRTSTSSMTSVPKPLKFLRPHYGTLKAYYETMADTDLKVVFLVMAPHIVNLLPIIDFVFLKNCNSTCFSIAEIHGRHTISIGTDNVCRGRTGLSAFFNIWLQYVSFVSLF